MSFNRSIVNSQFLSGFNVSRSDVYTVSVGGKVRLDVGRVAVIDEARIIATQDVTIQPRIDVSHIKQSLAKHFRLDIQYSQIEIKVQAGRESLDGCTFGNRFRREQAKSVNGTPVNTCLNQEHQ